MVDMPPQSVKPFVDLINRPCGRFARVGYRPEGSEHAFVSVDVPIHELEQAIARDLDLTVRITPSGKVVSHIRGWSENALSNLSLATSIDDLISQVVSPENLRLEEATTADLIELLKSLNLAIEMVKAAFPRSSTEG
jgi:hypothetical protein